MTTENTATALICELTFVLREAPKRSAYAGQLCAELRATSPGQKILKSLRELGLWHPSEECQVNVLETWSNTQKHYKILRFTASAEVYRQLHELCSPPDLEDLAQLTNQHIASLSVPVAIEALSGYTKVQLKAMAALVDPDYAHKLGKKATNRKLAEFICANAA